ncbi:hypothetical protein QFZ60_001533 [Arthrobacter sp. B2I5]|uniref:toll/interleukin-1 receptor domain-containing protein n=1 Tax=Arthrobacter sp. B2I5 TaxID=3042266 RepID=UPI0027870854|nr:toll/interleukin-1 receptor domain-containing protein [Arthrobacter sp. B2I5]MDQ0825360.1 hypothetical protein [Arthrobacter sp. B2I5]
MTSAPTDGRPLPPEFHAFISHTGEDFEMAAAITDALTAHHGWNVWLDREQLLAGPSLRVQIDQGLGRSSFGVVLLSKLYFEKYWTASELDAIFSLESGGRTNLIPVLLDMEHSELMDYSPILSSRFSVSGIQDPEEIAQKISDSMEHHMANNGYWSGMLRRAARVGLLWAKPPEFFPDSLQLVDRYFVEFWAGRDAPLPEEVKGDLQTPSLPDLFEAASLYEGKMVAIVGHQGGQQVLRSHARGLHEYVLRIASISEHHRNCIAYVRLAEVAPGTPPDIPMPKDGELAIVIGTVIARGAMTVETGEVYSAVYLAGARVHYLPKLS